MGGKRKGKAGRRHKEKHADALVGLLNGAHAAVEQALDAVVVLPPDGTVGPDAYRAGEPCGPAPRTGPGWSPIVDPLLLDRYHGLLTRSGMVAGSVHHLPSRLRERAEGVLRELVVGVARDRGATGPRVDALIADLLETVGQQIAAEVVDWRDTPD